MSEDAIPQRRASVRFWWWLWGFVFWRHWDRLRDRLSRSGWYHDLVWQRLWPKRRSLVSCPVRHWLVNFLRPSELHCPHCGYEGWADHDELWTTLESGTGMSDYGTTHWWRGLQTCWRCGVTNEHGDST